MCDCGCSSKRKLPPPRTADPCSNPPVYDGSGSTNPFNFTTVEPRFPQAQPNYTPPNIQGGPAAPYSDGSTTNSLVPRIGSARLALRSGGCCGKG